ncbi:kinase-like protein [Hymenopellis radicata]|nr:kinase-like protein [Hymenopellis radicata]
MALLRRLSIVSRLFRKATRTAKSTRSSDASTLSATISISSDASSSVVSSSAASDLSSSVPPISPPVKRYAQVGVQTESLPCHVADESVVGSSSSHPTGIVAGALVLYSPASCPTIPDEDTAISLHTSAIRPRLVARQPLLLPNLEAPTTVIPIPQSISIRGVPIVFLRRLGSGTYGTVLLAQSPASLFAVKTFPKRVYLTPGFEPTTRVDSRFSVDTILNEKRVLQMLGETANPFFPKDTFFFQDHDFFYILMTLHQRSLYDEILRYITYTQYIPDETLGYWSAELAQAVAFLHSHGLYHMDIKPQNVMITDAGHLCLIDFGMTTEYVAFPSTGDAYGTPGYDAPEIYKGVGQFETELFDAYAFGQVLADMYLAPLCKAEFQYPLEYLGFLNTRNPGITSIIIELTQSNPSLRRPVSHFITHPALQPELPQGVTSIEEFAKAYIIDSNAEGTACVVSPRAGTDDMDVV